MPVIDWTLEAEALRAADRPIEGDPNHHLGVGVLAPAAANFPNPVVGLPPDCLEMFKQLALHRPSGFVDRHLAAMALIERIQQLAVNVELPLTRRRVANANRLRSA